MQNVGVRYVSVFCWIGLLPLVAQGQAAKIELKAVKLNPTCVGGLDEGLPCTRDCDCDALRCGTDVAHGAINPNPVSGSPGSSNIAAGPTDVVVAEFFASDWSDKFCQDLLTPCVTPADCVGIGNGTCEARTGLFCDDLTTPCTSAVTCGGIGSGTCAPRTVRVAAYQLVPDLDSLIAGNPTSTGDRGQFSVITGNRCCRCPSECLDDVGSTGCTGTCDTASGICNNAAPRAAGAFIDRRKDETFSSGLNFFDPRFNRRDFIFFKDQTTSFTDLPVLDFTVSSFVRYGNVLRQDIVEACTYIAPNPDGAGCVRTTPQYMGTLIFKASIDACGVFTLPFVGNLIKVTGGFIQPMARTPLTIDTGVCDCRNFIDPITPPNCSIDARQLKEPDGSNPQVVNSMTVTFDCADAAIPEIMNLSNWTVNEVPDDPFFFIFPSTITPVGNQVTVTFNRAIRTDEWTCLTYTPPTIGGSTKACVGLLPGDVDNSRTSDSADVLAIKNCLTNPGSCVLRQLDADRSGENGPADILRVIDLLNGAGAFDVWQGRQIPVACPSAAAPSLQAGNASRKVRKHSRSSRR